MDPRAKGGSSGPGSGTEHGSKVGLAIGQRIAELRGSEPQHKFARRLGVSKNTLGRYERGERVPDADVLLSVARLRSVSVEWLMTGKGSKQPQEHDGDVVLKETISPYGAANEATVPVENVPLERLILGLRAWWARADAKQRAWLELELLRHFPELAQMLEEKKPETSSERSSNS